MFKRQRTISINTPSTSSADLRLESRSTRLARKAKPSDESLVDGTARFRYLRQALQAAKETDTIAIIPPEGSDEDENDIDGEHVNEPEEVAGELELLRPQMTMMK